MQETLGQIKVGKLYTRETSIDYSIGDIYWKDFKHLAPRSISAPGLNKELTQHDNKKVIEPITFVLLLTIWFKELVKGIKKLFNEGTLHGVKYIFEPSFTRMERFTWILIMTISLSFCTANIIQLFSKWTSTPFVNVMDSLPTPVWAVPFPTVVMCPELHLKLSFANISELNGVESFFSSLICPQMAKKKLSLPERLNKEGQTLLQEFILEASPKCQDVVKKCYWGSSDGDSWMTEECCTKFLRPIFTNYGLCYAFNTLPLNGMSNRTIPWFRTFDSNPDISVLSWNIDHGYPKNFDLNDHPYRAMASGEQYGFGAELFLNSSEHQYLCDGSIKGFIVLISSPTDHVYSSTVLRLPMDTLTSVEVTPLTYKTDSSLRKLTPKKRQCYFQNERRLKYYSTYTDSNCKHDLIVREVRKICGCVAYNWPREITDAICSTAQDIECFNEIKDKVEQELILAYFPESEDIFEKITNSATCYPSCNDILYTSQVFYSDIRKETETDFGDLKPGEIARVNVHFYDDMFLGLHRHAQYDDYYFVGAIGGLLSLFLGFSIISLAEMLYFIIIRPIQKVITICVLQFLN